jgi:S-adenosylmethionine synthetase
VMGYRHGRELVLTIALAFVDRFVCSSDEYFGRKAAIVSDLQEFVDRERGTLEKIRVDVNTLDAPSRGEAGMYLTVLGTSAEGADCGQVGRGNKVNGVIPFNRPMSTEAAAGKNPVSHVGKIYNLLSHKMADSVYHNVEGIREVYIWLCSQIGVPIDQPLIASAHLVLQPGVALDDIRGSVSDIIDRELADIYTFTDRLTRGEFSVW